MSTIVTRAGKGSALTHNEVDANFTNLNTDKIEAAQTVTLTNKTISGSNNTLSNIGNSSLTNSSVTIGSTSVSLGSTATTVSGLTLSSPTVSGGTINNAVIGGTTPAAITGTTITANTSFSGALNGSVGATTPSTGSFTSLTDSGNLTFTGAGNRITGDFSNATIANRVMFQTSTVNTTTAISAIPNGTGVASQFAVYSNSDPTNASVGVFANNNATVNLQSAITGTGTYLPMTFFTGGSERMRVDTSGNVGIGTSSPIAKLNVKPTTDQNFNVGGASVLADGIRITSTNDANTTNLGMQFGGSVFVWTSTGAERMRIDSSGNLLVGGTTILNSARQTIYSATGIVTVGRNTATTAGKFWNIPYIDSNNIVYIINQNNAGVFMTDGATSWSANSDERLKDIIEPIENAADKVASLRAVIGRYKTDAQDKRRSFLIAQDVEAVLPEAVSKSRLPNSTDETEYLAVSYTDTIPLLVAAIQEQQAMIEELKAEVAALKGA